jgi:hypothetical protein
LKQDWSRSHRDFAERAIEFTRALRFTGNQLTVNSTGDRGNQFTGDVSAVE